MTEIEPRVTVVIPTHSRERMLFEHALPSALGQRSVQVEVVVVCDGAPPELVHRVESVADPRISVVTHGEARGVASARNAGIEAATSDWVAILDDDDLWAPTKLAEQVAAADRAGAGFAYSAAVIVDEQFRVKAVTPAPRAETLLRELLARNVMPGGGSNLLARRELLQSVGGFDAGTWYMSDWDMAIRLAVASPGAAVPDPLVAWVRHDGATAPSLAKARHDLRRLEARHSDLSSRHGVRFDEAAALLWVGNSELEVGRPGHRLRAARAFVAGARSGRRPSYLAHAGRAVLGKRGSAALRARLRDRPPTPDWLAARSPLPAAPAERSAAGEHGTVGEREQAL